METAELEKKIIDCIIRNIGMSGEQIPAITGATVPLRDIDGFDSLRIIEVIVDLEVALDIGLQPKELFSGSDPQALDISGMSRIIKNLMENKQ